MLFRKKPQSFQPPLHIDKLWPIYKENIFVNSKPRRLPFWLPPLLTLLSIILVVFYLAPTISQRLVDQKDQEADPNAALSRLYDASDRVVQKSVADVYMSADIKARRLTQVLYNEPVRVTKTQTTYGFDAVVLADGTRGYMLEADLSTRCDSAEPTLALNKLVVTTGSKRIMSHAKTGTLLAEVMMGTVLYADYRGDGISRVLLPSGESGWISDDGLIVLPPDGLIEPVPDGARYFTSTALSFLHVTLLNRGLSVYGASIPGVARVAAGVNGVELPRLMMDQFRSGESVPLKRDPDTDLVRTTNLLLPGDLLFFGASADSISPTQMAICISENSLLIEHQGRSSIRLLDPAKDETLWRSLIAIRRIFPDNRVIPEA